MTRRLLVVLVTVGCGQAQAPALCGDGTLERGGVCVAAAMVRCGAGTELQGDSCLALPPVNGLRCGANTTLQGNSCEGVASVTCGGGTALRGAECVPNFPNLCGTDTQLGNNGTQCLGRLACGAGTTRTGDTCAANLTCGAGTIVSGGQCVGNGSSGGGSPTLAAFAANPALHGAHNGPTSSGSYSRVTLITTFAQSQAEAWTLSSAAPVGPGSAIQIGAAYASYAYGLQVGDFTTVAIYPDTSTSVCPILPSVLPNSANKARVAFVEWAGSTATVKACAKGGSVRYERLSGGNLKVTLNVEFNDGTLWQDKSFTVASVGGY